ncbi:MAG: hypothetical protein DBX55_07805 [Verrucomicrobia bacterium]|nr:MAG: hypothetical protein DBX55_07805 [Verrucomicrobiota bacterium]
MAFFKSGGGGSPPGFATWSSRSRFRQKIFRRRIICLDRFFDAIRAGARSSFIYWKKFCRPRVFCRIFLRALACGGGT